MAVTTAMPRSYLHHSFADGPYKRAMEIEANISYANGPSAMPFYTMSFVSTDLPYESVATIVDGFHQSCAPDIRQPMMNLVKDNEMYGTGIHQVQPARNAIINHHQSAPIKREDSISKWSPLSSTTSFDYANSSLEADSSSHCKTNIDTLMKTIQAQIGPSTMYCEQLSGISNSFDPIIGQTLEIVPFSGFSDSLSHGRSRPRNKYQCSLHSCGKVFFQKTHLDIHVRAHTGYKPFVRHHVAPTYL